MISPKLKGIFNHLVVPVAKALVSLGITANMITIAGFFMNIVTGLFIAYGRLLTGGILIIVSGCFDMIDGAIARIRGSNDSSGALLDSVIDRYSEAAIFLGIAAYFYNQQNPYGILLAFATMVGSFLVSYVRARAEGLDVECKVGLMQRTERLVLLSIGIIIQSRLKGNLIFVAVLALLTAATHITALHRLIHSFRKLRGVLKG